MKSKTFIVFTTVVFLLAGIIGFRFVTAKRSAPQPASRLLKVHSKLAIPPPLESKEVRQTDLPAAIAGLIPANAGELRIEKQRTPGDGSTLMISFRLSESPRESFERLFAQMRTNWKLVTAQRFDNLGLIEAESRESTLQIVQRYSRKKPVEVTMNVVLKKP